MPFIFCLLTLWVLGFLLVEVENSLCRISRTVTVRHLASSCHVCSPQVVTRGFDMEVFHSSFPVSQSPRSSGCPGHGWILQGERLPRQVDDWVGQDQHWALGRWCCTELGESFPTMEPLRSPSAESNPTSPGLRRWVES